MTELEWVTCIRLTPMLDFLSRVGPLSEWKARLFGIAVVRRCFTDPCCSPEKINEVERYLDGLRSAEAAAEREGAGCITSDTDEWLTEMVLPDWVAALRDPKDQQLNNFPLISSTIIISTAFPAHDGEVFRAEVDP